jgi:hypothetical protein
MFDELATEKRIRWDDKTNNFLGVCRQHGRRVSLQFNHENDLEELFRHLETDDERQAVHYAGEVGSDLFLQFHRSPKKLFRPLSPPLAFLARTRASMLPVQSSSLVIAKGSQVRSTHIM